MLNLEKPEKILLAILIAALLFGAGILVYRKNCPVGNLRIEYSGSKEQSSGRTITKKNKKININEASAEELKNLKGIGAVLAGRIVEYRANKGLFISIDDLKRVRGIGNALFEKIKDNITIE